MKVAAVSFGRLNPPTRAHGLLVDVISAQEGTPMLFLSHSQDSKKNPLSYEKKVYWCKKAFDDKVNVVESEARNMYEALTELWEAGYTDVIYVCGSDRAAEAERMNNYNGKPDKNGNIIYDFNSISVVKAGNDRINEDDIPIEMVSASMQRKFAAENDLDSFISGCPERLTEEECEELFNDVREGMGITEELNEDKIPTEYGAVSDNCKQFLDFIYSTEFNTKQEASKLIREKFGLIREAGRSIYGNNYFSVRFSQNSSSQGLGRDETRAVTIMSIKRVIAWVDKPLFNVVINTNTHRATVWMINLKTIKLISGPYYAKNLKVASPEGILGSINGADLLGEKVTSSNFDELWQIQLTTNRDEEIKRIFKDTIERAQKLADKHIRPTINMESLKLAIENAKKYISSIQCASAKELLDKRAELCSQYKEDIIEIANGNIICNVCEDIIRTGRTTAIADQSILKKDQNLADIVIDPAWIDIKVHYITGSSSDSGKLMDIEKLIKSINTDPSRVYMFYNYELTNGTSLYTNVFDTGMLKTMKIADDHGGAGHYGQLYGAARYCDNNIDADRVIQFFETL